MRHIEIALFLAAMVAATPLLADPAEADPAPTAPAAAQSAADEPAAAEGKDAESEDAESKDAEDKDSEDKDSEDKDADAQQSFEERLDALLSQGQVENVYGETQNCLFHRQYRDITIINDNMLLFSKGDKYWLNTLKHECLGLKRDMVINIVLKGVSSLCRNDQVFANRRYDIDQGVTHSGRPAVVRATCILGDFQRVDPTFAKSLESLER